MGELVCSVYQLYITPLLFVLLLWLWWQELVHADG